MRIAAAVFVLLVAGSAIADEVKKKDGVKVDGTIVKEDDESVTIRNDLGDITIKKKDVETINGKAILNYEDELEKVRRPAAMRLEELAHEAELQGKKDLAKKLRDFIETMKTWDTKTEKKTEKASKPETKEEKERPDKAKAGRETFLKYWQKWRSVRDDKDLTDVQRRSAFDAIKAECSGKKVLLSIKVSQVAEHEEGSQRVIDVSGQLFPEDRQGTTLHFYDKKDFDKLAKAPRDSTIFFEATITTLPEYQSFEPALVDPHLK